MAAMFTPQVTYIGIDPTAGRKPITYVAMDGDLGLVALGSGDLNDVMAFIGGQSHAVVALCAPPRPNQGLMKMEELRASLNPPPRPSRWMNCRLVEFLLRQRRITIPLTPADEADCPAWMRTGFVIHHRLEEMGYQPYPSEAAFSWLEVYPHASYCALLEHTPFSKNSLEGRIQRQLALYQTRLNVPDPMLFFEEITRHRLLQGILPTEELYSPEQLDALVAVYTAWLVVRQPSQVTWLGDPQEGQIALPTAELKPRY